MLLILLELIGNLFWIVDCDVEVLGMPGKVNISFPSVPLPFNNKLVSNTSTGVLLSLDHLKALPFNKSLDYILICESSNYLDEVNALYASHALAIIGAPLVLFDYPGRNYYYHVNPPLVAPVIEMKLTDFNYLMQIAIQSNWTLSVNVTPGGENQWIKTFSDPSWIFAQCFISVLCLGCMVSSSYVLYWKKSFPKLSHGVLILELVSNTVRLIWWSVDPVFSRLIFPYLMGNIFQTITLPFTISTSLMIAMFWFQLLKSKALKVKGFISRYTQVLFVVLVGFVFLLELGDILYRVYYGFATTTLFQVIALIYFFMNLFTWGFYIYAGISIISYFKTTLSINPKQRKLLSRIQRIVIPMCIAYMLIIISHIISLTPFYETILGYTFVWTYSTTSLISLSYIHISAFWPEKKELKRTTETHKT